jgi:hypothetical protein
LHVYRSEVLIEERRMYFAHGRPSSRCYAEHEMNCRRDPLTPTPCRESRDKHAATGKEKRIRRGFGIMTVSA